MATPCIDDHQLAPSDFTTKGHLSPVAARIVLKGLYVARFLRRDIYWSVNVLAREVTKWTMACDKRLKRLIAWMHYSKEWVQTCFVGDKFEDLILSCFVDASFAGDLEDSKSTSGGVLCLVGPNTFAIISWMCKKQGAVSHSSSEAEIISLETTLRMEALPALELWDTIIDVFEPTAPLPFAKEQRLYAHTPENLIHQVDGPANAFDVDWIPTNTKASPHRTQLLILEDNEAVIKMAIKGRSMLMRHISRTHRIDLSWLFERLLKDPVIRIKYVNTKDQLADILTKGSFSVSTCKFVKFVSKASICVFNSCDSSSSRLMISDWNWPFVSIDAAKVE